MLLLGSSFSKMPVMSLRIGTAVGTVVGHLINPHNLKIDALWVRIGGFREPHLLLIQDIREVSLKGVVVDDHDVVIHPSEAHRLKPIVDLQFELIDKKVLSTHFPLGKVADYAVDKDSFFIQKLYVTPNAWKKLHASRLTIDRAQIVEVSHSHVRVKGDEVKESTPITEQVRQSSLSSMPSASAVITEE